MFVHYIGPKVLDKDSSTPHLVLGFSTTAGAACAVVRLGTSLVCLFLHELVICDGPDCMLDACERRLSHELDAERLQELKRSINQ